MSHTRIFLTGSLESIDLKEPFQATMTNMSAAMNTNMIFFAGRNMSGEMVAVKIAAVTHMVEIEDAE